MKYFISKAEYTNNKTKMYNRVEFIYTHSKPIVVHQYYLDKSNYRDCIAVSTVTVETIVTVETTVTVETGDSRDYGDSSYHCDSRDYGDSRLL